MVSFLLLVVGGLNWGLVGLLNVDLVETLLGSVPAVQQLVYVLVGLSAVYEVLTHAKRCMMCGNKTPTM
jgi:uncharacterized membrane protein YuzA (DUF378 family)